MSFVIHFLLIYDHNKQKLIERRQFANGPAAAAAYAELEARHRQDEDLEIVLVGADSLETIQKTHGHYFAPPKAAGEDLFPSLVITH